MMKVNAMAYAHLIKAMMPGDLTMHELAEETGLHYQTVRDYVNAMHKAGVAHITRFDPDSRGRHTVKIFQLGEGKDAKRIRMTQAERQQAHRARERVRMNPLLQLGRIAA